MRARLGPHGARPGPGIAEEAASGDGERLVAARIERVAEAIADDVERSDGQEDGQPRKNCQPPRELRRIENDEITFLNFSAFTTDFFDQFDASVDGRLTGR